MTDGPAQTKPSGARWAEALQAARNRAQGELRDRIAARLETPTAEALHAALGPEIRARIVRAEAELRRLRAQVAEEGLVGIQAAGEGGACRAAVAMTSAAFASLLAASFGEAEEIAPAARELPPIERAATGRLLASLLATGPLALEKSDARANSRAEVEDLTGRIDLAALSTVFVGCAVAGRTFVFVMKFSEETIGGIVPPEDRRNHAADALAQAAAARAAALAAPTMAVFTLESERMTLRDLAQAKVGDRLTLASASTAGVVARIGGVALWRCSLGQADGRLSVSVVDEL